MCRGASTQILFLCIKSVFRFTLRFAFIISISGLVFYTTWPFYAIWIRSIMDLNYIGDDFGPLFYYQFRFILIGDSTVGKSSLLKYFTEGRVAEISDPTVGVDFYARMVELKPGYRIKLQLWDTAGQEKFRYVNPYKFI